MRHYSVPNIGRPAVVDIQAIDNGEAKGRGALDDTATSARKSFIGQLSPLTHPRSISGVSLTRSRTLAFRKVPTAACTIVDRRPLGQHGRAETRMGDSRTSKARAQSITLRHRRSRPPNFEREFQQQAPARLACCRLT
jgi:hypothetical protein